MALTLPWSCARRLPCPAQSATKRHNDDAVKEWARKSEGMEAGQTQSPSPPRKGSRLDGRCLSTSLGDRERLVK